MSSLLFFAIGDIINRLATLNEKAKENFENLKKQNENLRRQNENLKRQNDAIVKALTNDKQQETSE